MQVAQITLPVFLARCEDILKAYALEVKAGRDGHDSMQTDELLCVLEILATMSVSSDVADAALQDRQHLQVLPCPLPACYLQHPTPTDHLFTLAWGTHQFRSLHKCAG